MTVKQVTLGRCDDCGGSKHPYIVYRWSGKPLLRDALCPVHKTPLVRTTRPKDYTRIRDAGVTRIRDAGVMLARKA